MLESRDGWLFHTNSWLAAQASAGDDRSFAVVDEQGSILAVAALRRDWLRALGPLSLPRLYNGRAGLAHRAGLAPELEREVDRFALARVKALGQRGGGLLVNWERPSMMPPDCALEVELASAGYRTSALAAQVIDLAPEEDALLAAAQSRCRRDVRRAQKLCVQVQVASSAADVAIFAQLHRQTMASIGGAPWPDGAALRLWSALAPAGCCEILLARNPSGSPVAGIVTLHYRGASYYHAAASAPGQREWLGNTRLVWEAIVRARARGDRAFHLGPVPRRDQAPAKAYRVGQFKAQFGGREQPWLHSNLALWPGLDLLMRASARVRSGLRARAERTFAP